MVGRAGAGPGEGGRAGLALTVGSLVLILKTLWLMLCFTICLFQVRKSSQEVLLILLEQDLIFQHDTESKVCPVLLALSAPDSDDEYRAEAVSVSPLGSDSPELGRLSHNSACAGGEASRAFSAEQRCSHKQGSWWCGLRQRKFSVQIQACPGSDYPYIQLFQEGKAWEIRVIRAEVRQLAWTSAGQDAEIY